MRDKWTKAVAQSWARIRLKQHTYSICCCKCFADTRAHSLSVSCLQDVFYLLLFHFIFIPPPTHTRTWRYWHYCIFTSLQNKGMLIMNDGVEHASRKTQGRNRADCTSPIFKKLVLVSMPAYETQKNRTVIDKGCRSLTYSDSESSHEQNGKKERRGGVVVHGLTCNLAFPSLFPHFHSQYRISAHVLSHWVRNQSFSLPVFLPIHLYCSLLLFILAFLYQLHTLPVGTNEHASPLSHGSHPWSMPMVNPVLLHRFSP